MKKNSLILLLLTGCFSLRAQITCTNIKLVTDYAHYTVTTNHDSTFVKQIQFSLSDTTGVSKIHYTLSNLTSGSQTQKDYYFDLLSSAQNLTVANNCIRNKKSITISLGYFNYLTVSYLLNIKLYDGSNNLLSNTDYNFNH